MSAAQVEKYFLFRDIRNHTVDLTAKYLFMSVNAVVKRYFGVKSRVCLQWYFLPRKASNGSYDGTADQRRGTNLLLIADQHFHDVQVKYIGEGI